MKNMNITLKPVHYVKLAGLALFIFWLLTFHQRAMVLVEHGVSIKPTDMTKVKYLVGISHSAEEMDMLLELRKSLR